MDDQPDLFGHSEPPKRERYPDRPGWREPDTSRQAAEEFAENAETLRGRVYLSLRERPATVHEMAIRLRCSIPAVQPRFSELRKAGKIRPSGEKRRNLTTSKKVHVWEVCK